MTNLFLFKTSLLSTLPFKEYAISLLVTQANLMNTVFKLDLASPLTAEQIHIAKLKPAVGGVNASVAFGPPEGTFSRRYSFELRSGYFSSFKDVKWDSYWHLQHHGRDWGEKISKMTNLISSPTEALGLILEAFSKLGGDTNALGQPTEIRQIDWLGEDGIRRKWPFYNIRWDTPGEKVITQVCGITRRISEFSNFAFEKMRPVRLPANYFQMLGLPPTEAWNYADLDRIVPGFFEGIGHRPPTNNWPRAKAPP